jgi:hypothetical protein
VPAPVLLRARLGSFSPPPSRPSAARYLNRTVTPLSFSRTWERLRVPVSVSKVHVFVARVVESRGREKKKEEEEEFQSAKPRLYGAEKGAGVKKRGTMRAPLLFFCRCNHQIRIFEIFVHQLESSCGRGVALEMRWLARNKRQPLGNRDFSAPPLYFRIDEYLMIISAVLSVSLSQVHSL